MICTLHLLNGDKTAMGLNINGSWVDTRSGTIHFSTANDIDRVFFNNVKVWEKERAPFANGYTLYGDYFLSNVIIPNRNWSEACAMTQNVTVTQGAETKTVTAKTLSAEELKTLTREQRQINENGHNWYWTSTPIDDSNAWGVFPTVDFRNGFVNYSGDTGGARLGFKNPFI